MNFTITVVEDALWSGLEITLGIINACLPVIPPAARRIFNGPLLRLISFSKIRSPKQSRMLPSDTGKSSDYSRFVTPWMRLGNSKGGSDAGIVRELKYSVDIESGSTHGIPMESMGSTKKLADNPAEYHYPPAYQYYGTGKPPS